MSKISKSNRIDLNLYRVFLAVMRRRSVSGASRDLGVTASAISHALARLRKAINDDLFIPGYNGMEPSPKAKDIHSSICDAVAVLEAISGSGLQYGRWPREPFYEHARHSEADPAATD